MDKKVKWNWKYLYSPMFIKIYTHTSDISVIGITHFIMYLVPIENKDLFDSSVQFISLCASKK